MSTRKGKEPKKQKTNANKHTESNMATAAFIQCECSATTFMAALFSVYDENGIDDIICAIQASFKSSSSRNSACCVVYFFTCSLDCINDLRRRRREDVGVSGRRWKLSVQLKWNFIITNNDLLRIVSAFRKLGSYRAMLTQVSSRFTMPMRDYSG